MSDIGERKLDHLRVCLTADSQASRPAGFDALRFEPVALPEIALGDVDLGVELLGRRLAAPFLVSSMTGGVAEGGRVNRHLAEGAAAAGVALALGSQRIAILHPEARPSFEVRAHAPGLPLLLGNLGAVQLNYGFGLAEARAALEMAGADGLYLHLNPLQEAIQEGGDTNFRGLLDRIGGLAAELGAPLLVKEVGSGLSASVVSALVTRGVAAVDVSGSGGTSWARVEGLRAASPLARRLGETFRDWGLPTPLAIAEARAAAPEATIIGSGGIRNGLDAAKALALGADVVGIAQPLLAPALESGQAVAQALGMFVEELRVACFCLGVSSVTELKRRARLRPA